MSAQHTQGRVKVQHPHAGERGWEVAFEPGLEQLCQDITEANARRLAACWNRLEPFTTEQIEDFGYDLFSEERPRYLEAVQELRAIHAQRDELLGALRMLLLTAGEINDAPDGLLEMALESDDQETRNQANAHLCARAAIAKVEGKTK